MEKISNLGSVIKRKIVTKINNRKIRKYKAYPEKLDVKLEHKNRRKVEKLVKQYNRELRPVYKKSLDAETVRCETIERELKKFDLKQYWKIRQANHAYAKSLFSQQPVADAAEKHAAALEQLANARREKIKELEEKGDKYVAEHQADAAEREAAAQEYAQRLAERQKTVDETVANLREERKNRLEQAEKESAEKIALLSKQTEEAAIEIADDAVLDVKNLCMYFGGLHAVEDLSFDVKKGEIFGLIGPNGAGKTTVFNCITQFYKCTSGEISFRNRENKIVNLKKLVVHDVILEGIARTFQNVEVIKEQTVLENLLVAATRSYSSNLFEQALNLPILNIEEKRLKEKAIKLLEVLDLLAYKDWLAWGLPYGILKKVEIARALMARPKLLILDEPAAGLNNTETLQLAQMILKIRDEFGCSILLVEHDMSLVMSICDRICAISFGKMLALGSPQEIQADRQVQEAYLGVSDEAEKPAEAEESVKAEVESAEPEVKEEQPKAKAKTKPKAKAAPKKGE